MKLIPLLLLPLASVATLAAQDTTRTPDNVRVVLEYQPGVRPGMVVVPGAGLDSLRTILACYEAMRATEDPAP